MDAHPHYQGTILIVDDNRTNLNVLADYLESSGFKVLLAIDGERALRQVVLLQPDLILLDIIMPGQDGFETCRQLKANKVTRNIPIIFMTALTDTRQKVKAFQMGAVDYVTKPFQQDEVLARITAHLTIQRQKQELEKLNATKDKFFSIISHDLKGSFHGLLGYSKLLVKAGKQLEPEEIETAAENLHRSARYTFKLLENLLNWARIQRGQMRFKPEAIHLDQVVEEHLQLFQANAAQKGIRLFHTVAPEVVVYADLKTTETILRNLLSNAIKFTSAKGQVQVSAEIEEDRVKIAVADSGIGIAPKYLSRLFKIDESYKRYGTANEKGTGLGLILCQELVERNRGEIWIESKKGKGTIIYFTLPHMFTAPKKQPQAKT